MSVVIAAQPGRWRPSGVMRRVSRPPVSILLLGVAIVLGIPRIATPTDGPREVEGRIVHLAEDRVSVDIGSSRGLRVGAEGAIWYDMVIHGRPARRITVALVKVIAVERDTAELILEQRHGPIHVGYSVTLPVVQARSPSPDSGAVPCTGHVVVKTDPPGAAVHVAGVRLPSVAPTVAEDVPCGAREVVASLEHHESGRQSVDVRADRPAQILLTLVRRPASVRVIVVPEGAAVWIDGRPAGAAPATVTGLEWGAHRVRVEQDGFAPFDGSIDVASASLLEYRVTLTAVARPCAGKITIDSQPRGAQVEINGSALPGVTPMTAAPIPCGPHRLAVRLPDHGDVLRDVDVSDRQVVEMVVALTKQRGTLQVEAEPTGADVLVDGRRIGSAPVLAGSVDVGRHVLRVEREGFVPEERAVDISVADPVHLRIALTRAAPTPAWVLVSTLGYEGVSGLERALTVGLLESQYAVELDGKMVVDWHIRSVESRVWVPSGHRRLRVLVRNTVVREPIALYDDVITLDRRDNRVRIDFFLGAVDVNGTRTDLQKRATVQ